MKRILFNEIKKSFEKEGYKVLTKENEYKGAWSTKIEFICPNNHKYEMVYPSFRKGHRCKICMIKPFNEIKKSFEKEGYKVLTKENEYINTRKTYIKFLCNNNHTGKIEWNNWLHGGKCSKCNYVSFEHIKNSFGKKGYKVLTKENEYINTRKTYIKFECPKKHIHMIKWNNWQQGQTCRFCYHHEYDVIKKSFEIKGYELLTKGNTTIQTSERIFYKCPNGHISNAKLYNWLIGFGCRYCNSSISENEIKLYVESLGIKIIENDRTQILNPLTNKNLELDIWIPTLNKAIEFNGDYWHSRKRTIKTDKIKKEECEKQNIDLLVIWEHEWGQ